MKRTADITYNIANLSVETIENISPTGSQIYLSSTAFLNFFDRILPRYPTHLPVPLETVTLENMLYQKVFGGVISGQLFSFGYAEILLMPLLVQQTAIQNMKLSDLPAENAITAWYCEKSYKLSVAPASYYSFVAICLAIISWCVALRAPSLFRPMPKLSLFPDVDFLAKLAKNHTGRLSNLGSDAGSTEIESQLHTVSIKVEEAAEGSDEE